MQGQQQLSPRGCRFAVAQWASTNQVQRQRKPDKTRPLCVANKEQSMSTFGIHCAQCSICIVYAHSMSQTCWWLLHTTLHAHHGRHSRSFKPMILNLIVAVSAYMHLIAAASFQLTPAVQGIWCLRTSLWQYWHTCSFWQQLQFNICPAMQVASCIEYLTRRHIS